MIPQETIEQVRQATDIGQVVGEFVRLRRRGRNFEALCPFHEEKTPSFKVNVDKQIFHCFGCGKGGNVFTFLMEHERMSFIEVVRLLAKKANIQIRETVTDLQREHLERLNYAQQVALEYFQALIRRPQYSSVLDGYLRKKRGLADETIAFFQLGLADDSWEGLVNFAQKKGIGGEDLVAAGLASKVEKSGKYVDRFRERLMIPIFNLSNKPIAFGGRTLKKGENVKYINSPETKLYSKSNILYGLNFSRDAIRTQNAVLIVEGYFDFISLWQAGVRNVVASSGTAFTAQQARLIARFAENVFLFFDADSAGQAAALRSIDALYDAGLEVHVMRPPSGMDPDNVARELGKEGVEQLQASALRYIPYRLQGINVNDTGIIGREKLIKELSALAGRIADPTRRAVFLEEAAALLKVDRSLLHGDAKGTRPSKSTASVAGKFDKLEFEFLSLLCSNPPHLEFVFEQISADDFESKKLARLYGAMIAQYRAQGDLSPHRLFEVFEDDDMRQMVTQLAVDEWDPNMVEVEIRERTRDFLERRQKRIRQRLQKELAQAEADGNSERANELLEQLKAYGL